MASVLMEKSNVFSQVFHVVEKVQGVGSSEGGGPPPLRYQGFLTSQRTSETHSYVLCSPWGIRLRTLGPGPCSWFPDICHGAGGLPWWLSW